MTEKRAKESVHYTAHAMKRSERCKLCEHFIAERTLYGECEKVKGHISPFGWCELFKKKSP